MHFSGIVFTFMRFVLKYVCMYVNRRKQKCQDLLQMLASLAEVVKQNAQWIV